MPVIGNFMNPLLKKPKVSMVGGISTTEVVVENVALYATLGGIGYALWKHRWGWALASAAAFVGLSYWDIDQAFADTMTPTQAYQAQGLLPPNGVPATMPAGSVIPQGTTVSSPGGSPGATIAALSSSQLPIGSTVILNGAAGPQQYTVQPDGSLLWVSQAASATPLATS